MELSLLDPGPGGGDVAEAMVRAGMAKWGGRKRRGKEAPPSLVGSAVSELDDFVFDEPAASTHSNVDSGDKAITDWIEGEFNYLKDESPRYTPTNFQYQTNDMATSKDTSCYLDNNVARDNPKEQ